MLGRFPCSRRFCNVSVGHRYTVRSQGGFWRVWGARKRESAPCSVLDAWVQKKSETQWNRKGCAPLAYRSSWAPGPPFQFYSPIQSSQWSYPTYHSSVIVSPSSQLSDLISHTVAQWLYSTYRSSVIKSHISQLSDQISPISAQGSYHTYLSSSLHSDRLKERVTISHSFVQLSLADTWSCFHTGKSNLLQQIIGFSNPQKFS